MDRRGVAGLDAQLQINLNNHLNSNSDVVKIACFLITDIND